VLHSHLRPEGPAPPAGRGKNELTEGQEAVVSTSPCAVAGDDSRSAAAGPVGDGELESCVFCRIIRDEAPAFKVGRALSSSSQFFAAASVACSGLGWAVVDKEGNNYMGASSTHPKIVPSDTHSCLYIVQLSRNLVDNWKYLVQLFIHEHGPLLTELINHALWGRTVS
jgi:hypothetical protein